MHVAGLSPTPAFLADEHDNLVTLAPATATGTSGWPGRSTVAFGGTAMGADFVMTARTARDGDRSSDGDAGARARARASATGGVDAVARDRRRRPRSPPARSSTSSGARPAGSPVASVTARRHGSRRRKHARDPCPEREPAGDRGRRARSPIVPDLIVLLDEATGRAVPTERVRFGQRVTAISLPSAPVWRTPAGPRGRRAGRVRLHARLPCRSRSSPVAEPLAGRHRRRRHEHRRGRDRRQRRRARPRQDADDRAIPPTASPARFGRWRAEQPSSASRSAPRTPSTRSCSGAGSAGSRSFGSARRERSRCRRAPAGPTDLVRAIAGPVLVARGGVEVDGRVHPLDPDELRRFASSLATRTRSRSPGAFSPLDAGAGAQRRPRWWRASPTSRSRSGTASAGSACSNARTRRSSTPRSAT